MQLRSKHFRVALVCAAWLIGCGSDKPPAYQAPGDVTTQKDAGSGNATKDAGSDGGEDAGGSGGDGSASGGESDAGEPKDAGDGKDGGGDKDASMPDASSDGGSDAAIDAGPTLPPMVRVLSPGTASDADIDDLLVGTSVEVRCEVVESEGGDQVDPTSVEVDVFTGTDMAPARPTTKAQAQGDGVYRANIPIGDLPAGRLAFECRGQDTAERTSSATIETLFDKGPSVSFNKPADKTVVSIEDDVLIEFFVKPSPLTLADQESSIDRVELRLNGTAVSPTQDSVDASRYSYLADFSNTSVFPSAITELEIEVRATNLRSPTAVTANKAISINVDGDGPSIAITSPTAQGTAIPIVGSKVTLQATISDTLSGLKDGTARVEVQVAGRTDTWHLTRIGATNSYVGSFQSKVYTQTDSPNQRRAQLTLNFVAEDNAGNETRRDQRVNIDDVSPWVSLDPPSVREITFGALQLSAGNGDVCSVAFDPLGSAVGDGQVLYPIATYRTLVWERAVEVPGAPTLYYAGVDNAKVELWVQGDTEAPLLIDTDADGFCDAINKTPLGATAPILVSLKPVNFYATNGFPPRTADYVKWLGSGTDPDPSGICDPGTVTAGPGPACQNSDMSYIIKQTFGGTTNVPAVYAVDPTNSFGATNNDCTGIGWQTTTAGGWTCVAALASDASGNTGFAQPIRVCYELNGDDCPSGVGTFTAPPTDLTCTDGCVLDARNQAWGRSRVIKR